MGDLNKDSLTCRYTLQCDRIMISLITLKYLFTQRRIDVETLMMNKRYNGAVYLIGYSLEFSFKRRVSITLGFHHGFPETNPELKRIYQSQLSLFNALNTGITLNHINQLRNHDLMQLVKFSGVEGQILAKYPLEWMMACLWNPGNRYLRQNWTSTKKFQVS